MHKHKITSQNTHVLMRQSQEFKLCFCILVQVSDNSPCFSSQRGLCVCSYKRLDMDLYLTSLYPIFLKNITKNCSTSFIHYSTFSQHNATYYSDNFSHTIQKFRNFFPLFLLVLQFLKSALNNMRTYKKFIQVAG